VAYAWPGWSATKIHEEGFTNDGNLCGVTSCVLFALLDYINTQTPLNEQSETRNWCTECVITNDNKKRMELKKGTLLFVVDSNNNNDNDVKTLTATANTTTTNNSNGDRERDRERQRQRQRETETETETEREIDTGAKQNLIILGNVSFRRMFYYRNIDCKEIIVLKKKKKKPGS
jgi:hypothetical protein